MKTRGELMGGVVKRQEEVPDFSSWFFIVVIILIRRQETQKGLTKGKMKKTRKGKEG